MRNITNFLIYFTQNCCGYCFIRNILKTLKMVRVESFNKILKKIDSRAVA